MNLDFGLGYFFPSKCTLKMRENNEMRKDVLLLPKNVFIF